VRKLESTVVHEKPFLVEVRFRSQANPCGICGGQSGNGTSFYQNNSVFFPVNIIPPMLLSHISSFINDIIHASVKHIKPDTITTIKRLERASHLVRMSDDRTVNNVFLGKPDGIRTAGRPKLRWLDCIEEDLKSMAVKRWRKNAEDRSVCDIILKEALAEL
jgi:hypothetical protein